MLRGLLALSTLLLLPAPPGEDPVPGEAVRPVEARRPDPARLRAARTRLGKPETTSKLGPYALYTDLQDPERLKHLDALAGQIEAVYRARYGRQPVGKPAEAIVLFAQESDYQAFQNQDARLNELRASGHSGYGIVALFDGGRPRLEVGSTLVHELAHLLNRRAVGPVLPSWLDEGIADDLSLSRVDEAGHLLPGTLGGVTVRVSDRIQMYGPRAALQDLVAGLDEGAAVPLPELLALDWDDFVRKGGNLNYPQSAFWVRYLLDGEDGTLAPAFRAFLDAVAAGGAPAPEALREKLGRSWESLEAGFRAWVLAQREDRPQPVAPAEP